MHDSKDGSQRKLRVGILFGGKSAEHEVSLQSAKNVLHALDTEKFEPVLIGIDKAGRWQFNVSQKSLEAGGELALGGSATPAGLMPADTEQYMGAVNQPLADAALDVVFPVLHGTMGEDGSIQGLLELASIPYVGAGILSSAVGMDKDIMKRLLRDAGIAVADYAVVRTADLPDMELEELLERLGLPLFVKPANMGSSVGVSKVATRGELVPAVREALLFDTKVLIERAILGDEIECAVLGNEDPQASIIGRIIPPDGFYNYAAKYIDEQGATLEIPAAITPMVGENARRLAVQTFEVLGCEGMARVDMFAAPDGQVIVNEINTIPGFTKISMYPKLWEASGVPYTELITRLLGLAIERFNRRQQLQTTYKDHL
ncbi:MAG TPA: D-alanine--D-alanine ligase [Candidatus Saccharimonadales bacterium]|nr:D-alanine--D-alanine ligase [Candidatus Saccharimonadales bacterium]